MSKLLNVYAIYDITGLTEMVILAKFYNRLELSNIVKREILLFIPLKERIMVLVTVKENFIFF
jgi:hypothetical protein